MDNQPSLDSQQVLALIVDCYLRDNNFSQSRNTFRNEASFIFNNSPIIDQVSMNVMGLGEILNELKSLKNLRLHERSLMQLERDRTQTLLQCMTYVISFYYNHSGTSPVTNLPVPPLPPNTNSPFVPTGVTTPANNFSTPAMVDQESWFTLEQERYQTQLLLFSMQDLINTYIGNTNPNFPVLPPLPNTNSATCPQPILGNTTPTGVTTTATPPSRLLVPQSINSDETPGIVSTPVMSVSNRKRKDTEAMDTPSIGKKSRGKSCRRKIPVQEQNTLPQSDNLPVPKTPTETTSIQSDAHILHTMLSHVTHCNREATSSLTNKVVVGSTEQVDYMKSDHCISQEQRDHVRSRLHFESLDQPFPNEISTYESNKQNDLPELENFTPDDDNDDPLANISFSTFDNGDLAALLSYTEDDDVAAFFSYIEDDDRQTIANYHCEDQDLSFKGFDFSNHPTSNHSKDNASRSSHECKSQQVISELPINVAKVLSEKDMNIQGPNSPTTIESFKKSTTNLTSKRNRRLSFDKEN